MAEAAHSQSNLVKVLLVPSIRASMGSGHLKRCLGLARIFGPNSAVLLEGLDEALGSSAQTLLAPLGLESSTCRFLERYDPQEPWDLVIVDRRSSDIEQIRRFLPAPVVGLDEGGRARRYCSYLIDTFPTSRQQHTANLAALSLLDLPAPPPQKQRSPEGRAERRNQAPMPHDRVLISFGGEDPADLSHRLLRVLLRGKFFEPRQITVVQGPYFRRRQWPEGIEVLRNPADLKSMLEDYDLLFCSFGLTSYEALAAGVPVINLNPSAYHRRLSRAAGIPQIGVRRPRLRKLKTLLTDSTVFRQLLLRYPPQLFSRSPRLSELPTRLRSSAPAACPVCGQTANPALARFEKRSYFACRDCGMIYLIGFDQSDIAYDEGYFFASYQKQYGKTYLEDFQSIKRTAAGRLKRIHRIASGLRLLDIGCAYGPFLQAAAEQGFQAHGLDVAREAVRYVREQLGIPCGVGDFRTENALRQIQGAEPGFDVITMWYVIEHFPDLGTVLRRVNALLRRGGVFAFSTPNAKGISGLRSRRKFLECSPQDHHTVWSPSSTAGILERYGFRLCKIVVTGHHGERFLRPGRLSPESVLASGFTAVSRMLRLGDTFEAYAVKQGDLS